MDAKDEQLLSLLRENARRPVADLARRLGLSRTTVQSRLERLERSGVVAGYTVRLSADHEAALFRALIMLKIAPKATAGVEAALKKMSRVTAFYSISGEFDAAVVASAKTVAEMDRTIDGIGAIDGVDRTLSSIILSTRFDR